MNLLIEQRPTTITSSKLHQQQSQISNQNDMNNSSPSSPLVLKIKRHTTKQQQQQQNDLISTLSHMGEDDNNNNNSRSTPPTNQRLKRTVSNTTTRRPSSPAFNGKQQQSTKRSVTIDNNNNDLPSNIEDISATKRFKRDDLYQSSSTKVDASVETVSIGLATEPDHLGPCEPGTSVVLEGIVWNETDNGVLVVNVTWRGKTYVGTLLDSTKQDWACPRLTCESPTSDYDPRINSSKTSRTTKRTSTTGGGNNRCSNHQSITSFQQITSNILSTGLDDRKLRNNIKSRQSKRLNNLPTTINEESTTNSSPLTSPFRTNQTFFSSESTTISSSSTNFEPQLISCSESQCHKRFASNLALTYHISDAHKKPEQTSTIIPQANTRDEEDVAHILANVADYVRRSSPPSSIRCSPEHQQAIPSPAIPNSPPSILSWPCPQISSKLVLSSSLNNNERTISPTRCKLNNNLHYSSTNILENKTSLDHQEEFKSSVKSADHFLLHIQDEPISKNLSSSPPPPSSSLSNYLDPSWTNTKKDRNNNKKRSKNPTPPPSAPSIQQSSFIPLNLTPPSPPPPPTHPPTASSPAYSDISDEDPTTSNEQTLPLSTINLLTATNGKMDENGNNLHSSSSSFLATNGGLNNSDLSNPAWTAQRLFQQFGPLMQQQALVAAAAVAASNNNNNKESITKNGSTTPNRLNSKNNCPSSNGTSDSTVKNILDARRSSTIKSSSSPPPPLPLPSTNLYHYHPNETKFSPSMMNTLTSPNENLLHPSTTTIKPIDILDYSLNNNRSTNGGGQYHHSSR